MLTLFAKNRSSYGQEKQPRPQRSGASPTGLPESSSRRNYRRTVPDQQLFRCPGPRPGQIRNAAPCRERWSTGKPFGCGIRLLPSLLLSGAGCFSAGRPAGTDAAQARAEGSSQTHGRSTGFCSSGASAGLFAASGGSGRTREGPIQHHGPSTKHRARSGAQSKKTPVNEASAQAIAHEDFAADYEQLRGSALGITNGREIGLALFLRNGMAAWVHACSCGTPPPANDTVPPTATITSLSADVRSQATVILASIILNRRPEKTSCQPTCRK
jgi:hypothetical protein